MFKAASVDDAEYPLRAPAHVAPVCRSGDFANKPHHNFDRRSHGPFLLVVLALRSIDAKQCISVGVMAQLAGCVVEGWGMVSRYAHAARPFSAYPMPPPRCAPLPGLAPAGHLLFSSVKKAGKKGDRGALPLRGSRSCGRAQRKNVRRSPLGLDE